MPDLLSALREITTLNPMSIQSIKSNMPSAQRRTLPTRLSPAVLALLLLAPTWQADSIDQAVIPAKTEIFITLERTINTKTASEGDRFYGVTDVPVTFQDKTVVPVGSYVIGFVDFADKPGRLRGKSELRLRFDTVILPSGITRKIEAVVQSAEGQRRDPNDEEGTLEGGGSQTSETATTGAGGAVTGGVIGGLSGGLKGLGVGAGVGAATGALIGLLKKGQHVVLQRGTSVTIQLENDIRFVKLDAAPGTP